MDEEGRDVGKTEQETTFGLESCISTIAYAFNAVRSRSSNFSKLMCSAELIHYQTSHTETRTHSNTQSVTVTACKQSRMSLS